MSVCMVVKLKVKKLVARTRRLEELEKVEFCTLCTHIAFVLLLRFKCMHTGFSSGWFGYEYEKKVYTFDCSSKFYVIHIHSLKNTM